MSAKQSEPNGLPESPGTGGLLKPVLLVVALTLVVWVLFWQAGQPLDKAGTAVVALVVVLAVVAVRSLISRWRSSRSGGKSE